MIVTSDRVVLHISTAVAHRHNVILSLVLRRWKKKKKFQEKSS